jgi:hypothetical protein
MGAYAQYPSDVANNATSCTNDGPCPPDPHPCCVGGQCAVGCFSVVDAGADAEADAREADARAE